MVNPEVWKEIPHSQVRPAKFLPNQYKDSSYNCQPQVARKDQLAILGLIQRACRVKMVDVAAPTVPLALTTAFFLTSVTIVTSDVDGEIQEPSSKLLTNQGTGGNDGGLLGELSQFMSSPSNF